MKVLSIQGFVSLTIARCALLANDIYRSLRSSLNPNERPLMDVQDALNLHQSNKRESFDVNFFSSHRQSRKSAELVEFQLSSFTVFQFKSFNIYRVHLDPRSPSHAYQNTESQPEAIFIKDFSLLSSAFVASPNRRFSSLVETNISPSQSGHETRYDDQQR